MTRRLWQSAMIGLARSARVKSIMQTSRATSFLARKYVAGETPSEGVGRAIQLLEKENIRSSLFYMGEYVDRLDLVEQNVENKILVAQALSEASIDIHVSVDPTQIGHHIAPEIVYERAAKIAAVIRNAIGKKNKKNSVNCLMFDMEDASLNDPTINVHNVLQDAGYPVALTLQAYLKRTMTDMQHQIARGSRVRLVKGAFAAGPDIAYTRLVDVKQNSRALIDLMLSREAKEADFYPIIATHDTRLHDYTVERARQNGWEPGEYEFEMLLGVREDAARALALRGERVRLYIPFGRDWWPHAIRRIGENPSNALLLARSLVD
jgi:proline dehydrogenase